MITWRAAFLTLPLMAVLVSCDGNKPVPPRPDPSAPAAYGDTFVSATIGEASNLIPILASDSASHDIASLVYNGLLKYDKNLELVGDLAHAWDVSADGLTITFHLRKGVKWQDGEEFTSRDVLYTYGVIIDPKTPTPYSEDFKQVQKIEAPDRYTVRVHYARPFAPALASWGTSILPAHLLEGQDITKSPLTRKPVGTGPYRLKEWIPGQRIVLEAFSDYFGGSPWINRRVVMVIPDTSTMFMELKRGGVDMMALTPIQYARQTDTPEFLSRYNKYRYPASAYLYMGYNQRNPLFRDRRVRQALSSAINKKELVEGVLLGMGQVAHGPYKPGTWAYNPTIKDFDYNPERARKLLAEAGWTQKNDDGILVKDGKPFTFTVLTNQNVDRSKTAQIIQQRLRVIGVDMKIRVLEWAAFINNFIDTGDFEAVILAWTIPPDPDGYDIWHSSKTGKKELNFIHYNNPEIDRLLVEGRNTFDQEKRRRIYFRIQEILAEDQPYTFLYVPDALPVVSSRVRNIVPAPAGISYNTEEWYVPKGEQLYP
jgi:peptide/nickel transport system substrate-binding protein